MSSFLQRKDKSIQRHSKRRNKSCRREITISCLIIPLLITGSLVQAQEYPHKDINIDQFIQNLFSQQDEDVNYEELYESLFQFYSNPLNLNIVNRSELASLFILSEIQLTNFFIYRSTNGKLLSIYELQAIPGFDSNTIHNLLPFVEVRDDGPKSDNRPIWQRVLSEPNNYFLLRYDQVLEHKKGFTLPDTSAKDVISQRYTGSPQRLYARYRVSHSQDFSLGFTLEKDAGERVIWQPATRRYGMDFFSFHAQIQNRGRWKNIVLGDYQLQAGQSLILSSGFVVGKGGETVATIRRNSLGIRPYTSVLESGFFRGAAATYSLGRFDITGFYSYTRRDATVHTSTDTLSSPDEYIQSIYASGFHRTEKEINTKGKIGEQNIGSSLVYTSKNKSLQLGSSLIYTSFTTPLKRKPTVYNQFEFRGKENYNISLNYNYLWQNFNFFGEAARSKTGGIGLVSGFISSLTPKVELAVLYRNYSRSFHSFYGNGFGENTRNINERGMYWGIKVLPIRKLTFSAYYDKFRFPWLKFGADAPTQGYEYLLRISYRPIKTVLLYVQYREESKEKNQKSNFTPIDFVIPALRKNYLFNIDYPAIKYITFQSRVQFSSCLQSNAPTYGYAIIQDITMELSKLKLSGRVALYDTDNYDNRQYVYEKDVLYAFSIPAYYNRGIRNYLLAQYAITSKIDFWVRYARTSLSDKETISSGLEEINKPHKTEIKAQIRLKI